MDWETTKYELGRIHQSLEAIQELYKQLVSDVTYLQKEIKEIKAETLILNKNEIKEP